MYSTRKDEIENEFALYFNISQLKRNFKMGKNINESEIWKADHDTYNKIQKLIKFIDFVSSLEYTIAEQKKDATEIKYLIENINKHEILKSWYISLNIIDDTLSNGDGDKDAVHWRHWSAGFEGNTFEIEAKSYCVDDSVSKPDHFFYSACVFFDKELTCQRIYLDTDIDEFVSDAVNYKRYITETLNEIEVSTVIY